MADKQVESERIMIPLNEIWTNASIGPKRLRDLEPDLLIYRDTPEKIKEYSTPEAIAEVRHRAAKESLVLPIEHAMQSQPIGEKVGPGFAVEGIGRESLRGIYDVLAKGEKPKESFTEDSDLSLVFFTSKKQPSVVLDQVTRKGNLIEIRYVLVQSGRGAMTWQFALIPLGKLSAGEYRVDIIRSREREDDYNRRGFPPVDPKREPFIVSGPFSFVVAESSQAGEPP
jgi:hypothetical protein